MADEPFFHNNNLWIYADGILAIECVSSDSIDLIMGKVPKQLLNE